MSLVINDTLGSGPKVGKKVSHGRSAYQSPQQQPKLEETFAFHSLLAGVWA
jgi:hypothetical protein